MRQSRMARVYKLGKESVTQFCSVQYMEDFNSDDPLEIDARRDENDEETTSRPRKRTTRKNSMTKFTATLLLLATQKMLPRQTKRRFLKLAMMTKLEGATLLVLQEGLLSMTANVH